MSKPEVGNDLVNEDPFNMRTLVGIASVCMVVGFAVALVNLKSDPSPVTSQQAGAAAACTDAHGNLFYAGQKGYNACMEQKERDRSLEDDLNEQPTLLDISLGSEN